MYFILRIVLLELLLVFSTCFPLRLARTHSVHLLLARSRTLFLAGRFVAPRELMVFLPLLC